MAAIKPDPYQRRILQLSQEWGVTLPPGPSRLERPQQLPSYRTPTDDHNAEALLQRRATEVSQIKPKSGISRAFSSNNLKKGKNWDPNLILEVLTSWISHSGSVGVTEALIAKLFTAGVDLSGSQKQKSSILGRRKSLDGFADRTKLLKLAVQGNLYDTVAILCPLADPLALDSCLPLAIRAQQASIVELLVRYGASISQTAEGQDAFRQACSVPEQSVIVRLILQSDCGPSSQLASQCMVDSVKAGCLETVIHLSRSMADGDYCQGEALHTAIAMGRREFALAIIMGNKPPHVPSINKSFAALIQNVSITPTAKLELAELLLCAGAQGEVVGQSLQAACDSQFYEMASLLTSYGVSIEYGDANVLKTAICQRKLQLVSSLLNTSSRLSPDLASSCVSIIPSHFNNNERALLLKLLLQKGAYGAPLDEMLVVAAKAGDQESVELLLRPFRETRVLVQGTSNSPSAERHGGASLNYRGGEALQAAVLRMDKKMVQTMLKAQPALETILKVSFSTKALPIADRRVMIKVFLDNAQQGPWIHSSLQDAISEDGERVDKGLIELLLSHGADINFGHGPGLCNVILRGDLDLLNMLLSKASPQTAATRLPDAMRIRDQTLRRSVVSALIKAGAGTGVAETAFALMDTIQETPVDMDLLEMLLRKGKANVNLPNVPIVSNAAKKSDPLILQAVIDLGKPSPEIIRMVLPEIISLPTTDEKSRKVKAILSLAGDEADLNSFLIEEVQSAITSDPFYPPLAILKDILGLGANPNDQHAAALCRAVSLANSPITDLLFECQTPPTVESLGIALPYALRISDAMDRLSFTKRLAKAGAPSQEAYRGLLYAISNYPEDIELIETLASIANSSDGEALSLAVSKQSIDIVEIILKYSQQARVMIDASVKQVMRIEDGVLRRKMCERLLKQGTSVDAASDCLRISASGGDVDLCKLFMASGAIIDTQTIIEACRGGNADLLEAFLQRYGDGIHKRTLERGFQAATEIGDLDKRAAIFEKILKRGISGEPVDAQLLSAARCGEVGQQCLRILLEAGADPNYNYGEPVVEATRTAFMMNVQLLLGLWDGKGKQQKSASGPTMTRALKACWTLKRDCRIQVVRHLISAGLPVTDDIHIALNDSVNEDHPDEELVKLLLDHGASPTVNNCKTLVDAAKSMSAPCVALLLERPISQGSINQTLQCFTSENFQTWFSEAGRDTIASLLERGAHGTALGKMLALVMKNSSQEDAQLADEFIDMIISNDPDVHDNVGEALPVAASLANVDWTKCLIDCFPSIQPLADAFQRIFDTQQSEDDALELISLFVEYDEGDKCDEVMAQQPGHEIVLVRAMSQYPRSTKILQAVLDAGYYHGQQLSYQLLPEIGLEKVTLLSWAIAQPQKKISSALIQVLLDTGVNVNEASSISLTTPLMLAVQNRRADVVKALLLEGADANPTDALARSALSMASSIGGDVAVEIMGSLLAAEPNTDDGSLHNAARELDLGVVKVLVQAGHDPDFPSICHDGRSALAEVCLNGAQVELTSEQEKKMQQVMTFLIKSGADLTIKSRGKPVLYMCFDSSDPVATTRSLLKVGMWKHINKTYNYYSDNTNTYSPTMYVQKFHSKSTHKDELLAVLYANRCVDVYYANEGPQPYDAVGLPEDIKVQERERKFRLQRQAEESEDFALTLARKRELASVENQIWAQKAEMEDARRTKLQNEDALAIRSRAQLQESLEAAAHHRRLTEQRFLTESSVSRTRAVAAAEADAEDSKQRKALEWQTAHHSQQVGNARAMAAVRLSEREEIDRLERVGEERLARRLQAQRQVVESQEKLAKRIAAGPGLDSRRQIGYVESQEL